MARANDIIIADSDADMRTVVRMHFSRFGFAVLQATHGQEVIEAAERTRARLILLDTALPRFGAYEACAWLRRLDAYHDTPIVMTTANGSPKVREAAHRAGATKVVAKPLSLIDLCRELEPLLMGRDDERHPAPWRGLAETSPPLIWQPRTRLEWRGQAVESRSESERHAHRGVGAR
jgi:CheY-like chemotaxis protein